MLLLLLLGSPRMPVTSSMTSSVQSWCALLVTGEAAEVMFGLMLLQSCVKLRTGKAALVSTKQANRLKEIQKDKKLVV